MRRMCFACWIITDTATYPEYVIRMAFPLQQWLGEHASTLAVLLFVVTKFYSS